MIKFIMNIVLGVVYFGFLSPVSMCLRMLFGQDYLNIKIIALEKSYWMNKTSKTVDKSSFESQSISK
jgi:hypothetical protein